jgi:hypothetical protein
VSFLRIFLEPFSEPVQRFFYAYFLSPFPEPFLEAQLSGLPIHITGAGDFEKLRRSQGYNRARGDPIHPARML